MKRIAVLIIGLFVCIGTMSESYAQLSKVEKKEWKKKWKAYKADLEAFKDLVEENSAMKSQLNSIRSQVTSLESSVSEKDGQISDLTAQVRRIESDVSSAKAAQKRAETELAAKPASVSGDWDKGVVFRVQIGAFEKKDMSEFNEGNEEFNTENAEDMQKVTLGNFRDYWQADKFKKDLRSMGVAGAWIVPYKDGARVPIKDVLEGVVN